MNFLKKTVKKALNIIKGGFSVSPRILDHFGIQAYDSIKKSLVESASNSYDADATEVRISLPDRIEDNSEIILADNGDGMSTKEFQENYLQIGRDRRQEQELDTSPGGRKIIGNKGIGKPAGFGIAGLIRVETYITVFVIGKQYDDSVRAVKEEQERAGNFLMSYSEVLSQAARKFSDILKILENN